MAYGRWETPFQPIEPVLEHLAALKTAGLGNARIAELSGIPARTILAMKPGRTRCEKRTAAAILAVPVPRGACGPELAPGALVDHVGTMRRLQALAAIGWSIKSLAGRMGVDFQQVWALQTGDTNRVQAATARKVAALFAELEATDGPSAVVRKRSLKRGWAPPMAWTEKGIDDPASKPLAPKSPTMRFPEKYAEMRDIGLSDRQIAKRMGIKYGSLQDSLRRYGMPISDELKTLAHQEAA